MIDHLLTHSLSWYRPVFTTDAAGGQERSGEELVGTLRCQPSQPTADEVQDAAARWGSVLSHVLHALPSEDVQRGDEFAGSVPSAGERLRVLSVVRNSRSTYTRVMCESVQAEPSTEEGESSS